MSLLEVRDLTKHFPIKTGILKRQTGTVYAVDGISFSVDRGETLGLVGESGCGKSTAGRSILRLIAATGGEDEGFHDAFNAGSRSVRCCLPVCRAG